MSAFENAARLVGVLLVASALHPDLAWSQNNLSQSLTATTTAVAKVQTVRGTARIEHSTAVVVQANLPPTGADQTKAGDLVYRGDTIQTGADGALGITFVDGSSFNVSSNARMDVDEFLYDPNGHSNSTLIRLTIGTFSFIAGRVAKTGDMKVDTPVGVIGIRGTAPRIEISKDGSVKFTTMIEEK